MKTMMTRLAAAAALCALSTTAQAAVTYKLANDWSIALSFQAPAPITSTRTISDFTGQLCGYSTMTVIWANCTSVTLTPGVTTADGTAVEVWINARQGNFSYQFAADALGANGTYKATNKTIGTMSLTVSGVAAASESPASAVPEPATWALMLAGFGLTAAAMRRRRRTGRGAVLA